MSGEKKRAISTGKAPAVIGTYSQAVRVGNTVYLSGQIPLKPDSMELTATGTADQVCQVFDNLSAVAQEAGGSLNDIVKLTIYLKDLSDFATVNSIMESYFTPPYPARAVVGAAALPRDATIEVEAILVLDG